MENELTADFPHSPTSMGRERSFDAYPEICWLEQGDLKIFLRDENVKTSELDPGKVRATINVGACLRWELDGLCNTDGTLNVDVVQALQWQQVAQNLRHYADMIESCIERASFRFTTEDSGEAAKPE